MGDFAFNHAAEVKLLDTAANRISTSLGIASEIPVGIIAELLEGIFMGLSVKAIRSIPDEPSVLYDGN